MSASDEPPKASGTGRRDYLHGMMGTLWPEPARIVASRRGRSSVPGAREFVAVPNDRRPTLVLPRRPRRAAAAGLRHYKTSADQRTRLKLQVMSGVARLGLMDVLPSRLTVEPAPEAGPTGIDDYLASVLGHEVFVCIYIGPPRAVEKPVLQLVGVRGERLGFVKVGTNPLTRGLVRGEAQTLRRLAEHSFTSLLTPRALHDGRWNEHEVLVQEALTGGERVEQRDPLLQAVMVELATVDGVVRRPLGSSPFWRRLTERVDTDQDAATEPVRIAMHRLHDAAGADEVPLGSWHGDFAPWNMTRAGRRIQVWDWEHYGSDVPLGFDALHHRVQTLVVTEQRTPRAAFEAMSHEAPQLLQPFGVTAEQADLVAAAYVLEIASRYVHDGEHRAGTRMGDLAGWLVPVTHALSSAVAGARRR